MVSGIRDINKNLPVYGIFEEKKNGIRDIRILDPGILNTKSRRGPITSFRDTGYLNKKLPIYGI